MVVTFLREGAFSPPPPTHHLSILARSGYRVSWRRLEVWLFFVSSLAVVQLTFARKRLDFEQMVGIFVSKNCNAR